MVLQPLLATVRFEGRLYAVEKDALSENEMYILGWPDDDYQAVYSYNNHALVKCGYAFIKTKGDATQGIKLTSYVNDEGFIFEDSHHFYAVEVRHINYVNIDESA